MRYTSVSLVLSVGLAMAFAGRPAEAGLFDRLKKIADSKIAKTVAEQAGNAAQTAKEYGNAAADAAMEHGSAAASAAQEMGNACYNHMSELALSAQQWAAILADEQVQGARKRLGELQASLSQLSGEMLSPEMMAQFGEDLAQDSAAIAKRQLELQKIAWGTAIWAIPGALYRVWDFESSIDDIRKEVVVPLCGQLGNIRRDRNNADATARNIGRFGVFALEVVGKLGKVGGTEVVIAPTVVGSAVIPVSLPIDNTPSGLARVVLQVFVNRIYGVVFTTAPFKDRWNALMDLTSLGEELQELLIERLGWHELKAEIAQWNEEHPPPSTEEAQKQGDDEIDLPE